MLEMIGRHTNWENFFSYFELVCFVAAWVVTLTATAILVPPERSGMRHDSYASTMELPRGDTSLE